MGCAVREAVLDLEIPSRNKNVEEPQRLTDRQANRKEEIQKDRQIDIKTER